MKKSDATVSIFTKKVDTEFNENFIEIKDIVKQYPDGNTAVKKINLTIKRGEFVTILGPSGCGKTTLLKMLGGFELPTSGKILVKKIDIKDLPIQRRPTATVFQDYALFPNMNVEKNIAYGLKEIRKPIENIKKDFIKECEKYFFECQKKADSKIKDINKERNNYLKEIAKLENKIASKPLLKEINSLTESEYDAKIEEIKNEFEKKFNKDLLRSIPLKNKITEFLNNLFSFFKIDKSIKTKSNESDDLIEKYLRYERNYRENLIIKNKIEYLNYKSNDLDYWISYWQNYPYDEKEWFERKKITRKLTQAEIDAEVNKIISIIGLEGKNKKMPSDLSGGMQQRVALARALVIRPDILLLDEPLSALDAKVRVQMQHELKNLHKEIGITFILVTHDQEEALTLSDKVVVMSQGKIQQIGTPTEIYDYPSNNWVANFIGKANIFHGKYMEKNKVKIFGKKLELEKLYESKFTPGEDVNVMIRPEDFDVVTDKNKGKIKVTVLETIYKGLMWELVCEYEGQQITVEAVNKAKEDQDIYLTWDNEDMHIMKKIDSDIDDMPEKILTKQEFKKRIKKAKAKSKQKEGNNVKKTGHAKN